MAYLCSCGVVLSEPDQTRDHRLLNETCKVATFGIICPKSGELCSDSDCFSYGCDYRAVCRWVQDDQAGVEASNDEEPSNDVQGAIIGG